MDREDIELELLLRAIRLQYGYDFRDYSAASMKRRVLALVVREGRESISGLQHAILHDPAFFARILPDLTVTTSEMFRDPSFFRALREKVIPVLKTYPTFKVWHAGCSSGEEVYSLAILLREEGCYDRALIYATDVNSRALKQAQGGIYRADDFRTNTANYQKAGGRRSFSDYYTAAYDGVRVDPSLQTNVVFSEHNLVTDGVFSEVNLIICRNVLIYFNRKLQNRVIQLFTQSLSYKGFLCLGSKETVRFLEGASQFDDVDPRERIFRKMTREVANG